ncbi:DHA2 family efflux MFS transporter permease subunit [Lichenihabitans sp. PAMC28606]|uniref:DHA2 family efflux MFS transporter permease subunit n=1 Tax=Lichenihabitans sp. PAMC28606 TaxID=2880932 RepID=UPI001D0BBB67|nr:DHA2 family efflux MFS transporter permease subunit [Lichenihabitans sp. PAMC28606]UDL93490.1 DHA2 family efflux MFS transporter permease subunit [Lichenihabitans sp. PAMC28606]
MSSSSVPKSHAKQAVASKPKQTGAELKGVNPWVIASIVSIATFMEVLDTTIANVALRYIAGGLAVGPDEAAWVVTTYLVANAIVLCASGWISKAFGRKRFFLVCLALFSISSVLCGLAWSLPSLLLFRIMQGLAGGGMTPVAQSILAAAFPPEKRGQGFALYGIAVVVAPVVGPTLGGWLSDNYSWHWCFLINAPVGIACILLVHFYIPDSAKEIADRAKLWAKGLRFDYIGFILIATFLGALEVVLDRGQEDDWFGSGFIITFAVITALSLILFIPWELTRKDPVIDLKMLAGRQFGACFLVMLATGAILIATTQFLPQLLQDYYGYTATLAGLALSPGGLVTMFMMFVVGRISGLVQPKYLIAVGALIVALAMYYLTNIYADNSFEFFVWSRVYIGMGLPLIFIPITTASYDGIPPDKTDQASALINMARNLGGSMGVSLAQTILARREQFHQSRLVETVGSWNPFYGNTLHQATQYYANQGGGGGTPSQQAVGWIGQQVQTQAAFLAYIDVFYALAIVSAVAVPLALTLRSVKAGKAPAGAH